jgi:LmbE family N-acetylglucosaminyl deacetylase
VQDVLKVRDLGTVLGVWAHPDDEAYLSAGLMAAARDAGQRVVVATATEGEAGGVDGELRRGELELSLAAVDVSEHHWLGFADGECAGVPPHVGVDSVRRLLQQVQPDTVVTFGADGLTGHSDHITVGAWVDEAWRQEGCGSVLLHATLTDSFHQRWSPLNASYGLWMPDAVPPSVPDRAVALRVSLTGAASHRKLSALRAHASQTDALREGVGDDTFRQWWSDETFVRVTAAREAAA